MQRRDLQLKSRARIKSIRQKEGKWQQFLYGGVHWTPCDRPVIFRRCDHDGLKFCYVELICAGLLPPLSNQCTIFLIDEK